MVRQNRIAGFLIIFLSCQFLPLYSSALAQDKIVAVVNNEVITQKDLNDFSNFMRIQLSRDYSGRELETKILSLKEDLLNKLIEDRIILQEARKNDYKIEIRPNTLVSIKPDESRVKAKINEIRRRYPSDLEFQNDLARQGLVQADLEKRIREQLLMYAIVEYKIRSKIAIRPDEVTDFYNQNTDKFLSPEVRELEVIALENEDLARSFSYNLRTGQKLEDLATRYPITVNKIKVTKGGELIKDIEGVVFKLGHGEVSAPVKIEDRYFVFRLEDIIPPRKLTLLEAQDKINIFLFEEKMQQSLSKWINELKAESYIKIF